MKKTLLISLALSFSILISACNGTSKDTSNPEKENISSTNEETHSDLKRYAIESGSVTYEVSGAQTGTKTISWKDWGMTERTENDTSISAAGISVPNKSISLMKGDNMYSYIPGETNGTKLENTILEQVSKNSNKDLEEIGIEMMEAMGGKKSGTENIAGKTCDLYEISNLGTTTCIWKGINLKNDVGLAGMNVSEIATSVSTDTPEESLFELPSEVTFKDLGDVSDILKNL